LDEFTKEVIALNWKAALLLFVILFVSAITTIAAGLNIPKLCRFGLPKITSLDLDFYLNGDPIDNPGHPGR